jgi:tetratricopeptide (TPR) repeat protein
MGEIYGVKRFEAYYNLDRAEECINLALSEFQKLNLQNRRYEALFQLGRIRRRNLEASLKLFQECLRIAEGLGLLREQAIAKLNIADREFELHEQRIKSDPSSIPESESERVYRRIVETLDQSVYTLRTLESDVMSRHALAECYYLLGNLWMELKSTDKAMHHLREGLAACKEPDFRGQFKEDIERRVMIVLKMMQIHLQSGEDKESRRLFAEYQPDFDFLEISYPSPNQLNELIKSLEDRE